jgi:hypothetical protein
VTADVAVNAADWKFRIHLAKGANYLYNDSSNKLLSPLAETDGVVFPYIPSISYSYTASYSAETLTHTNFKFQTYNASEVSPISVTGQFTAQDENEAAYVLAMIHFFKSATKMWYGNNANNGAPPPVLYMSGFGTYTFDFHPVVLSSFSYTPDTNADYIRVDNITLNKQRKTISPAAVSDMSAMRLKSAGLAKEAPKFNQQKSNMFAYVPSSLSVSLSLLPVSSRADIGNRFDNGKYASGELYRQKTKTNRSMW